MSRASEKPGVLLVRNINLGMKTCIGALAQHISGNSHCGKPWALASHAQLLPQRILTGPVEPGQFLIHNHNFVATLRIVFVEAAASTHRNLHGTEIAGADDDVIGRRHVSCRRIGVLRDVEELSRPTVDRQAKRNARRFDARQ